MPLPTYKNTQTRKAERERKKQERMPKPWWWFKQRDSVARFTLYLGIFTLCLVLVGILQWCSINGQLEEMRSGGIQTASMVAATQQLAAAASDTASISEKTFIASQRAWVGATDARISSELIKNKSSDVIIVLRNTGKEPATNFKSIEISPISISDDIDLGTAITKKAMLKCMSESSPDIGQIIYPSEGFTPLTLTTKIDPFLIGDEVILGKEILLFQGCLVYKTLQKTRHTYFCFYYRKGINKIKHLGICPTGQNAD